MEIEEIILVIVVCVSVLIIVNMMFQTHETSYDKCLDICSWNLGSDDTIPCIEECNDVLMYENCMINDTEMKTYELRDWHDPSCI